MLLLTIVFRSTQLHIKILVLNAPFRFGVLCPELAERPIDLHLANACQRVSSWTCMFFLGLIMPPSSAGSNTPKTKVSHYGFLPSLTAPHRPLTLSLLN
jgi:hypothetical protein